ncbi:winged helix-turn-helix domain-containing protein [Pseudomonas moorei]|uniref:winged helix-turn-helix domain-containing protein n=1 Tax=Pseudomonas moorei TaxID=395599 RepID=UPI00200C4A8D|nr:winged helix-turn-helix domain-containing protein [Pseudomonas moorei]
MIFVPHRQECTTVEGLVRETVELGYSASRLLELLVSRADELVARDAMLKFAWPDRVVTQNSLNQVIWKLRDLLGDLQDKRIIQTVPHRGYLFNAAHIVTPADCIFSIDEFESPFEQELLPGTPQRIETLKQYKLDIRTSILFMILSGLVLSLFWRIDWVLVFRPNLYVQDVQDHRHHIVYTAMNAESYDRLRDEVAIVLERLNELSAGDESFLFNRAHDYYDVVCIRKNTVSFLSIHRSQLLHVSKETLQGCLK